VLKGFLDNDLYKFTMQQAVLGRYRGHPVAYKLFSRRNPVRVDEAFVDALLAELESMKPIKLEDPERQYLAGLGLFKEPYLQYLADFRFNPGNVSVQLSPAGVLSIQVEGPWEEVILWEVPVLALISELYFARRRSSPSDSLEDFRERSRTKGQALREAGCPFADFGTRRRYSARHQEVMIEAMMEANPPGGEGSCFTGTSNVELARRYGIRPVGTVAHEWIMAHEVMFGVENANERAMREWLRIYEGEAAIALTDTYSSRLFFRDFGPDLANIYSGVRQDSGSPEAFLDRLLAHYRHLGIDPAGKRVIFSDGLDVSRARQIHHYVGGRMQDAYGIGTHLTNDIPGIQPLDIVIKLTRFDGEPAVKLSDEPGKVTGDADKCRRIQEFVGALD